MRVAFLPNICGVVGLCAFEEVCGLDGIFEEDFGICGRILSNEICRRAGVPEVGTKGEIVEIVTKLMVAGIARRIVNG